MNRPTDIFENPGGRRGIRTPGTRNSYGSLANCWFQPLTHPSRVRYRIAKHCLSNAGAKLAIYFRPAKFIGIFFLKIFLFTVFSLIYLALSALFSTKSHHPPLSSQDHEATQTSSAARAREGLPKCAFCFITRLQNFLPEETHFLFSEQAQREAGEDEREGRLPEQPGSHTVQGDCVRVSRQRYPPDG